MILIVRTKAASIEREKLNGYIGHYHHLAQLDQLYTTAARLHHSLKLNDHTYIPYQLALVYVGEK